MQISVLRSQGHTEHTEFVDLEVVTIESLLNAYITSSHWISPFRLRHSPPFTAHRVKSIGFIQFSYLTAQATSAGHRDGRP